MPNECRENAVGWAGTGNERAPEVSVIPYTLVPQLDWQEQDTAMEECALTLNCGQPIRISELHQYRTYGGLLCGLSNVAYNQFIISGAAEKAKKHNGGHEPYLI